ncbi:MAG: SsrA-binding protein SmpB [Opitutae bacterium]|nr:SsrA-binding protein SmpB [Opitutae bacterium]MDA8823694.1 SsrA-binding protein SmpB [Opitutales bacterium]
MSAKKKSSNVLPTLTNPKARHKFILGDKFEAGIVLQGTEVKSIRAGNAQITESYARFIKDELYLFNAHISEYEFGGEDNHPTQRPRKLLLKSRELERLKNEVEASGKTLVPTKLYFKESLIKCEIAVGSGKNLRDKRQDLKKQVAQREADQALKNAIKR